MVEYEQDRILITTD